MQDDVDNRGQHIEQPLCANFQENLGGPTYIMPP